jgi:hypothetical protein
MPQPTVGAAHINAPLTNISVAYRQDASHFIATKIFPAIPVDHKSDLYWTIPKGDWFRDEARERADGDESAGSGYNLSTDSYNCIVRAMHKDIGNQARQNADAPFNLDLSATQFVTDRLLLQRENQFTADYLKTGVWGQDVLGVASPATGTNFVQWSDYLNSNPIGNVKLWMRNVLATTGFLPNTIVLGYDVWNALQEHPAIIDRIKYTSSDVITEDIVAKYFGLKHLYVSQAVINSAKEGLSPTFSFITGKVALLAYVADVPGLLTPTAGYTFEWRGVSGGIGSTIAISKFPMLHLKADRVEGETAYANKIVGADLGVFATSVVA